MLDFKKLGEIFHVSEVAMPIIKNHKEDFREEFLKDDGEKIVGLLNDVRLDSEDVKKSYDKILGLRKEVDDFVEGEDEIGKLNKEIEKLGLEILDFESKKLGEERRVEKFKLEKESVMEFVRGETKEIGVEII